MCEIAFNAAGERHGICELAFNAAGEWHGMCESALMQCGVMLVATASYIHNHFLCELDCLSTNFNIIISI
jgi:hypothetical protein